MNNRKFLLDEVPVLLGKLTNESKSTFGKMNPLQMLEHLSEWISISSGSVKFPMQTNAEDLPKWKSFLLSDKEFKPNTPNSLIAEDPKPEKIGSINEGIDMVVSSIENYFERFKGKENELETHPFFGPLNFEEWAVLHAKHIRHHLRQFGIL